MNLFTNQIVDANGTAYSTLKGLFSTLFVSGTFGGGTVTIEVSPDGTDWFDSGLSITEKTMTNIEVSGRTNDLKIRAVLTGSTAADITVILR